MVYLKELSPKGIRRLNVNLYKRDMNWKDLVQLRIADRAGNLKKGNYSRQEIKEYVLNINRELLEKPVFSIKDLDIDGHEVMRIMDLKPGPQIGRILNHLFEKVLENPEFNHNNELRTFLRWSKKLKEELCLK